MHQYVDGSDYTAIVNGVSSVISSTQCKPDVSMMMAHLTPQVCNAIIPSKMMSHEVLYRNRGLFYKISFTVMTETMALAAAHTEGLGCHLPSEDNGAETAFGFAYTFLTDEFEFSFSTNNIMSIRFR